MWERSISDEHVIGYGLDLDERFRNLPGLYVIADGRSALRSRLRCSNGSRGGKLLSWSRCI